MKLSHILSSHLREMLDNNRISNTDRGKINGFLHTLGLQPVEKIPLATIDKELQKYGAILVNEDGTAWEGVLTGREGKATFDLGNLSSKTDDARYSLLKSVLILTWHKFDTGRYEIVAYVS